MEPGAGVEMKTVIKGGDADDEANEWKQETEEVRSEHSCAASPEEPASGCRPWCGRQKKVVKIQSIKSIFCPSDYRSKYQ